MPAPRSRWHSAGGRRGVGRVLLGGDASWDEPDHAGRDNQRTVGPLERGADGLERLPVRLGGLLHPREVVVVAEMDDPVGRGRTGAQAVGIVDAATMHLGAARSDHPLLCPTARGRAPDAPN